MLSADVSLGRSQVTDVGELAFTQYKLKIPLCVFRGGGYGGELSFNLFMKIHLESP